LKELSFFIWKFVSIIDEKCRRFLKSSCSLMDVAGVYNRLGGKKLMGKTIRNETELAQLALVGIPKATLLHLADSINIDVRQVAGFLPVTQRNLHRYKDTDLLSDVVSDRLIGLAALFEMGEDTLGIAYFKDWLQAKNTALGDVPPAELLKSHTGIDIVKQELGRIAHGIFA
jgi:putative toxin-antitoxin system antitoxin component (TIGR02293 family)